MNEEQMNTLEKQVKWNKRHLRIVFIISSIALLMIVGHFILHFTGRLPH